MSLLTDSEMLNKLNTDSHNEKEAALQQDGEEHVMMAWETLDDSTIDKCEGGETKSR